MVNCHLHFDHCGNNPQLAGRPIFVQTVELRTAQTTSNYTLPWVVDFPGANYREVDGEAEILTGIHLIPTSGHTDGHQSVAVRTDDGTVVLAGQATDTAFDYASNQLAWRAQSERRISDLEVTYSPWIERLQQFDPKRVVFAHDRTVWEP